MGSAGEEVVSLDSGDVVFGEEKANVAGLSGGVTGEIDEFTRLDFEEFIDESGVAAGAGRVEDDGLRWLNIREGVLGFR